MRSGNARHLRAGAAGIALLLWGAVGEAAECKAPKEIRTTVLGMRYCVDPAFTDAVGAQAQTIRQDLRSERQKGKLIVYASTPISPRGGGHEKTNLRIAASVKARLEKEYGPAVWVLDPGRYQLPAVGGRSPGGEEYMVMWTEVLAGDDGTGRDFDMVHFTGPADMRAFFGCGKEDVGGCIARYLGAQAATDAEFRREVMADGQRVMAFLRYYTLRASSAYSKGARDEWNIFVKINRRRPLGEQIAMFFDGRPLSPAEMEAEVSPGYEFR
jgi:hypothetical protein